MPSFVCADTGMDCPFKASAPTQDELMKKITVHARNVHELTTISPDLMTKIKSVIKK